jgi:hypothetical protein
VELFTHAELDEIADDCGEALVMVGVKNIRRLIEHARMLIQLRLAPPGSPGYEPTIHSQRIKPRVPRVSDVLVCYESRVEPTISEAEARGYELVSAVPFYEPNDEDRVLRLAMHFRKL